ncbi:LIPS lipase, partial [Callaeas wilsoni]|nr:LIPS lipase [Callaeas wilsoni]
RALPALAGKLAELSESGCLFPDGEKVGKEEEEEEEEEGISEVVLREYSTMQNGCFYGRCLGFQVRLLGSFGRFWEFWGIFGDFLGNFWE